MRNYLFGTRLGSTRSVVASVAAAAAIVLGAAPAQAELLTFGTNTTPGFFGFAAAPVDINGPIAGTTLTFAGCVPGTPVMITYSAECSHSGTLAQWGTIQILLNGVALSPTNARRRSATTPSAPATRPLVSMTVGPPSPWRSSAGARRGRTSWR